MELIVDRAKGELLIDGAFLCYTIENPACLIPATRYRVLLTVSERVKRGTLWTPWDEYELPELVEVPGRTGIRIHAANRPAQLLGCIAVGFDRSNGELGHSRMALAGLRDKVTFPTWIEIKE